MGIKAINKPSGSFWAVESQVSLNPFLTRVDFWLSTHSFWDDRRILSFPFSEEEKKIDEEIKSRMKIVG